MNDMLPATAIVIPALNEEDYIVACLASLLDDKPDFVHQVIVVDGGSTDRTVELVRQVAAENPCVSLLHNPKRLQSAAVNLAARHAAPEVRVLLRADAHASYPRQFVARCIEALVSRDAASVVVPLVTVGTSGLQRAIAAAQNSRLGNGGSAHRIGRAGCYVEHGHHAAFDRAWFLRIGGYNEAFSHNEDAEFDHRLVRAGGRIWMEAQPVLYYPRRTLGRLAQQYVRNGAGRARTIKLHRLRPKIRHMLPLVAMLGCLAGIALMPDDPWFGLITLFYVLACIGWGAVAAARRRDAWLLAMGPAAMVMHMAWATGFVRSWFSHRRSTPVGGELAPSG